MVVVEHPAVGPHHVNPTQWGEDRAGPLRFRMLGGGNVAAQVPPQLPTTLEYIHPHQEE